MDYKVDYVIVQKKKKVDYVNSWIAYGNTPYVFIVRSNIVTRS